MVTLSNKIKSHFHSSRQHIDGTPKFKRITFECCAKLYSSLDPRAGTCACFYLIKRSRVAATYNFWSLIVIVHNRCRSKATFSLPIAARCAHSCCPVLRSFQSIWQLYVRCNHVRRLHDVWQIPNSVRGDAKNHKTGTILVRKLRKNEGLQARSCVDPEIDIMLFSVDLVVRAAGSTK